MTAADPYDDIAEYGDTALADADGWSVFDQHPPIAYRQDADWRRHAACAHDDLADGRWPRPRSAAEEMALRLLVEGRGTGPPTPTPKSASGPGRIDGGR